MIRRLITKLFLQDYIKNMIAQEVDSEANFYVEQYGREMLLISLEKIDKLIKYHESRLRRIKASLPVAFKKKKRKGVNYR